jgi:dipeptidase
MLKKIYYVVVVAVLLGAYANNADACTNYLVSKGASADGSVMVTYNADAGGFMEPFYYLPATDHEPGEMIDIYEWDTGKLLGQIPQIAHTYRVVGNMNEFQVVVGETTFTGRKELKDSTGIIDYGSLMFLALQRAKTAREAIKVMIDLLYAHGYYSTGESFSVGDKNEVWILEVIGRGPGNPGVNWVARRVPDGYVTVHANQSRINQFPMDDPENTIFNKDIIEFAIEKKYYDPDKDGEFSFTKAYCPLDPGGALYCEGRVWHFLSKIAPSQNFPIEYWRAFEGEEPYPIFVKPDKKLSVQDIMGLFRDHFEGTPYDMTKGLVAGPFGCPYRWKPLQWKIDGDSVNSYGWGRPVSTQQTAFSFVSQSRSWLPDDIGGIFWYGVDDNYTGVYTPLYVCLESSPEPYAGGSIQEFSFESAFWVFNLVANLAYTKYSYIYKDIEPVQQELESKFFLMQPSVEQAAASLYKTDPELAREFLSNYSLGVVDQTMERWQDLWKYLVVKYNDGYINDVNKDGGRHPKGVSYGDEFLKKVLKERPNFHDVKWKKKGGKIK